MPCGNSCFSSETLSGELVRELAGINGVEGNGGVVPSEEFVKLEGGDKSTGEKGGVLWAITSDDQIV